ncbi:hypothetical protein OBBRIDRAFT_795888 [Obba rivulosa]|uniref:Uncharacterized protein n=1 Tax=Obba rivulosa TaxID=1052685 RepID=A0A8E2AN74_9APHY|nr:hypothetical protein OBBRIDRAFT_795888 [Obba rivulosa]
MTITSWDHLLADSDWILASYASARPNSAVYRRVEDRLSATRDQLFQTIWEFRLPLQLPVPLSLQIPWTPQDSTPTSQRLTELSLQWINYLFGYTFLDWKDNATADNRTFIPQLYMRDDVSDEHKASIVQVMTAGAESPQLRRELGGNKKYLEQCIRSVLGVSSNCWKFVRRPEHVHEGGKFPFTVVVPVEGEGTLFDDTDSDGRSLLARAFHNTALLLIQHHYKSQGWSADRILTVEDAHMQLDERLYLYGICYNATELCLYASYPAIVESGRGNFHWIMFNRWTSTLELSRNSRPHLSTSLSLFLRLLAVEQHMRVLESLLFGHSH